MEKRIYSLNLAAYIMMATGIEPELNTEENLVYCVFPVISAVAAAIEDYKADKPLHNFLNSYNELRQQIKEVKDDK